MAASLHRIVQTSGLAAAALCGGWIAGQQPLASIFVSPAHATSGLTPLQKLLIKDEIRDKLALYGFLADGDGIGGTPRNLRVMADTLMTPDVVSDVYLPDGSPVRSFKGRELVAKSPSEVDPARAKRIAGRHYLVSTVFDEISATMVKTRTSAVYFAATKPDHTAGCDKAEPGSCGQRSLTTIMWVYHMTWKNTPQGWQIVHNVLRDDN